MPLFLAKTSPLPTLCFSSLLSCITDDSTRTFSSACSQALASMCVNTWTNTITLTWFSPEITLLKSILPGSPCHHLTQSHGQSSFLGLQNLGCGCIHKQSWSLYPLNGLFPPTFWTTPSSFSPYLIGSWFFPGFVGSSSLQFCRKA